MSKSPIPLAIAAFWAVMMGMLVQREVIPLIAELRQAAQGPSYRHVLGRTAKPATTRMGIYFNKRRVGDSETRVTFQGKLRVWRILNHTHMSPAAFTRGMGFREPVSIRSEAAVGPDSRLLNINVAIHIAGMGPPYMSMRGNVVGNTLRLLTTAGDQTTERVIPYDARYPVSAGMSPFFGVPDLYVGRRWRIRTINPLAMQLTTAWAEVVRSETMERRGEETEVYVVKTGVGPLGATIWISEAGEVIKQTALGGRLMLLAEPPELSDPARSSARRNQRRRAFHRPKSRRTVSEQGAADD